LVLAEDVPIPEHYKFEAAPASIPQIRELLNNILSDFDAHSARFDPYRHCIAREKDVFDQEVSMFASSMAGVARSLAIGIVGFILPSRRSRILSEDNCGVAFVAAPRVEVLELMDTGERCVALS
jgi:hypothetical protein